jgi:hypothetical protein
VDKFLTEWKTNPINVTRYLLLRFIAALLAQRHSDFKLKREQVTGLLIDLVSYPGFVRSSYQPSFQLSSTALEVLGRYREVYSQPVPLWVEEIVKNTYFKESPSLKKNILLYLRASSAGLLTPLDYSRLNPQLSLTSLLAGSFLNETSLLQSLRIFSDTRFYQASESGFALISRAIAVYTDRFLAGSAGATATAVTIYFESLQENPEMQWHPDVTRLFVAKLTPHIQRLLNSDGSSLPAMKACFLYKYLLEFDHETWTPFILDQLRRADPVRFTDLLFRILEVKSIADQIGPSSRRALRPHLLNFISLTIQTFQTRILEDFSIAKQILIFLLRIDTSQLSTSNQPFLSFFLSLESTHYPPSLLSQLSFELLKRLHYRLQTLGHQPSFTKTWLLCLMASSPRISLQDMLTCSRFVIAGPADFPVALQNANLFKTFDEELLRIKPGAGKVSVSTLVEVCRILEVMLDAQESHLLGKYTHASCKGSMAKEWHCNLRSKIAIEEGARRHCGHPAAHTDQLSAHRHHESR